MARRPSGSLRGELWGDLWGGGVSMGHGDLWGRGWDDTLQTFPNPLQILPVVTTGGVMGWAGGGLWGRGTSKGQGSMGQAVVQPLTTAQTPSGDTTYTKGTGVNWK